MKESLRRLLYWVAACAATSAILYRPQVSLLLSKTSSSALVGLAYPEYPLAGLVLVLGFLGLRWRDVAERLRGGADPSRKDRLLRLAGAAMAVLPAVFNGYAAGSLVYAPVVLVVAYYGLSIAVNPATARLLLPYAALYAVLTLAPGPVQSLVGEPLADLASALTRGALGLASFPIAWEAGRVVSFNSLAGGNVRFEISPYCSSISSITVFLLLVALMHLDLRQSARSSVKLAAGGVAALTLLNAGRIVLLVLVGYTGGVALLWSVHDWIGYAIFFGFYSVMLLVYVKRQPMGRGVGGG